MVAGCLAQRYGDELQQLIPEADVIVGTGGVDEIARHCLDEHAPRLWLPSTDRGGLDGRVRAEHHRGPSAFVKVGEGCSQRCSFCIIPALRGPLRTRPVREIVAEVEMLAARGVREVNLIGQDTTSFGRDRPGAERLPDLLQALDQVDGVRWIRLLYAYPARLSDRLIRTIAEAERVCAYVDIPLQHVDDAVLRSMARGTSERTVREVVRRLREGIPGLTLRTTLLVGFPGERERAFDKLMQFVAETRFERLGAFAFSPEEGTPAARMTEQVPPEQRQARLDALMELQRRIHLEYNAALVGTRQPVLVEGLVDGPLLIGRTEAQAPEVDGHVILDGGEQRAGDVIEVEISGYEEYDLVGRAVGPETN